MGPEVVVPTVMFVGFFGTVVSLVWLATRKSQARTQARAEVQKQLINKFDSGRELAEFLGSEGSKFLLDELGKDRQGPRQRVLTTMTVGAVLSAFGIGFLALIWEDPDLVIPAAIFLSLGVGFLIAAAVSHRLSEKWGMYKDQEATPESGPPLGGEASEH